MKKPNATASSCPEAFDQNLLAYSATAAAALLLAPAGQAQSAISHFYEEGLTANNSAPTPMALGSAGHAYQAYFRFSTSQLHHGVRGTFVVSNLSGHGRVSLRLHTGQRIAADSASAYDPAPIKILGNRVNIAAAAQNTIGGPLALRTVLGSHSGHFFTAVPGGHKSGYVGFKSFSGDYGWLKLKVTNDGSGNPLTLEFLTASDGLYGQIGDDTLLTPSAIPEPATVAGGLSLLALGAAGVREMRRRRKVAK